MLHRCWWRILATVYVNDNSEMTMNDFLHWKTHQHDYYATNITVTIECVKYKIIFSVILGRVRQWDDIYFSDDVQWIVNSKKTNCSWKYWSIKGLASGTSKESVSNKSRKSNARTYIRLEKLTFGFYMICHTSHMISVELDLVIFRLKTLKSWL